MPSRSLVYVVQLLTKNITNPQKSESEIRYLVGIWNCGNHVMKSSLRSPIGPKSLLTDGLGGKEAWRPPHFS